MFASHSRMCGNAVSRRDDMISLGYLLLYLVDKLPFTKIAHELNSNMIQENFAAVK